MNNYFLRDIWMVNSTTWKDSIISDQENAKQNIIILFYTQYYKYSEKNGPL